MSFGQKVVSLYQSMDRNWDLPDGFELIDPYSDDVAFDIFSRFYHHYFDDQNRRTMILGINPGRHGAGITGVPFTDPKVMESVCGIPNPFAKKHELSSIYVYDVIDAYGGVVDFYSKFYISSVCLLGFLRDGVNCNYYDDKVLMKSVEDRIVEGIRAQIGFGIDQSRVIVLGNGKNFKYFSKLNKEYNFFEEVVPLPHPRWVMQYRRKRKEEFIDLFLRELRKSE